MTNAVNVNQSCTVKKSHDGFTLLEILIVLAIIGALSALVVPAIMAGRNHYLLAEETRTVAGVLRYTRSLAMTSQSERVVVFDMVNKTVTAPGERQNAIDGSIALDVLTAESEVEGDRAGIRFYPDGASSGGRVTLVLGEDKRAVDVVWMTGQVNILEEFDAL
ncbi:GspH/FimT family pseudopilin [Ostreibacterium oceani]|uniref:Type II secretion system protein H n=1 Tax=Ostreibacterium oceani TaxID=2654998 RepID=A0A6N7EX67_9GAMM|nr:GspH/FimT family pseudopilin [Ostreibacterium oceani]MPV85727.1 prepilin-type N-terminal cleavage/methylation domain-containing protein [Ostreibacterium oceani]